MDREQMILAADEFVRRCKMVTLDTLLDEQEAIAVAFDKFQHQAEARKVYWIRMNGWEKLSKPELLELARARGRSVRTSDSKPDLLAEVVASFWNEWDEAAAWERAQEANDRIRQWANRLREVPQLLQELIDQANEHFEEQWKGKLDNIHEAANVLRWHGLKLMEYDWAATKAQHALEELEKGKALADVVHILANEVQMAIMGVIAANLSATGTGLEHMSAVGGAKLLTWTFYRAVPEEAKPFLSTVYR